MDYRANLEGIIKGNRTTMQKLEVVRKLNPREWFIAGGAIRSLVFDYLHEYNNETPVKDIDVIYFDSLDFSEKKEEEIRDALRKLEPDVPWEVVNQARVHLWMETKYRKRIEPFFNAEAGLASWVETATAVGVRLLDNDELYIAAPLGLDDLFNMVWRRNKKFLDLETYRKRFKEKEIAKKWPKVKFVDE